MNRFKANQKLIFKTKTVFNLKEQTTALKESSEVVEQINKSLQKQLDLTKQQRNLDEEGLKAHQLKVKTLEALKDLRTKELEIAKEPTICTCDKCGCKHITEPTIYKIPKS